MSEEVLSVLRNGNRLRGLLKDLEFSELQDIQDRLDRIVKNRKEEEDARRAELQKKEAALQDALQVLQARGLAAEDLISYFGGEVSSADAPKRKRAPRPAKYQWFEDGETKTWTGQGRKPLFLQRQEAAGKNIDEFLVK